MIKRGGTVSTFYTHTSKQAHNKHNIHVCTISFKETGTTYMSENHKYLTLQGWVAIPGLYQYCHWVTMEIMD